MSLRDSPLGKGTSVSVPIESAPTTNNNQSNLTSASKSAPAPPPQILLNNLNIASSKSSVSIKASCNSINTTSTTASNNNAPSSSGNQENSQSAPSSVGEDDTKQTAYSSSFSKSRNTLFQRLHKIPRLSREVHIDIDDNEDHDNDNGSDQDLDEDIGNDQADDLHDSTEHNNLLFRIGRGSETSETLRLPGIFTNGRRISSTDNLLEGEMSEEKLLKALEDEEARDYVPSPSNRWRKTSESNGLNQSGLNKSPRTPLRSSKSSSALLGNRQPTLGQITSNSLWMSHDCADDYLKHECDEKCSSALHMAVKTGNLDEVEIQLETGADPNARDCYGRTPLHYAVTMGMLPIIKTYDSSFFAFSI